MNVVFKADGTAGILTGPNHEGYETVLWIGTPEVLTQTVDPATGNGEAAYSNTPPVPEQNTQTVAEQQAAAPAPEPTPISA